MAHVGKTRPATAAPPRVVVEAVRPQVDGGRFPVKRSVGERIEVGADVHADGHDVVVAVLLHRRAGETDWIETPMQPLGNDAWTASFELDRLEDCRYTVEAWTDPFRTWRRDLDKRMAAGQATGLDLKIGAEHVAQAAARAPARAKGPLEAWAKTLREAGPEQAEIGLDPALAELMAAHVDRGHAVRYEPELVVAVDRERARFGAWYEMFPRSCAPEPGRHGTLRDCAARLPYVASMGFDIVYLPPIHPIGRAHRKGKNNSPTAAPGDLGSPWAIGAEEGGHTAVHPELGTLDEFRALLERARELGLELAMDLAFQCTPDHPYVRQHPEWFRKRPDGTVQHAENPPKKYEDIYPLDFETPAWRELWEELRRVVQFWIDQGVRVFRVDNPHTKPFAFWEWLIGDVRRAHPDTFFLAEAFTRPKVMYRLAKLGFNQSYTYFAWRNTKHELTEYFTELTRGPAREFFRPNLWPNTPDILTEYLQYGGRGAFMARLVLAATLGAAYGIYGPAFELCEGRARSHGSEEYLDSEKYQIRNWDLDSADSLKEFIARVNRIRRQNPALHADHSLSFYTVDNPQLIAYAKSSPDGSNVLVTVVNLDPHHAQSGYLELPEGTLGLDPGRPYQVHDLLTDARFFWSGSRHYVHLDPAGCPAHVFRLRRRLRTERDFDYFL